MTAYPKLLSPITIGNMALRNRIVMSPMENQYETADGRPSARSVDFYTARARGGVGLITLGACSVDARHKEIPASLHFSDDSVIDAHRALTDAVHAHGAKIQPQLSHAGPDGLGPEMHQVKAMGPSAIQSYLTRTTSDALTRSEFQTIVDQFRAAAERIQRSGYDGIELHAAHGYMLLGSFLTPWRNARRDEYTAHTEIGRTRAVVEVIRAIKSETGPDFPLTLRISGYERVAGGRDSPDTARLAPRLVEAGVDAFHVSGGVIDRLVTQMVNGSHERNAINVAASTAVKRAVDVPVMVVGRLHDPVLAEGVLRDGGADLIALARPLLADPELPRKLAENRGAQVRQCISCQNCIDSMETELAMDCAINPRTGRERELKIEVTDSVKRVIIVGGGPAGLEAARVAALRGHRVTLYEKQHLLGGALRLAATVHSSNQPLLDYLRAEVRRAGVSIRLGATVDADSIASEAPDAVIVATGGRLETRRIPGDELPHVLTGSTLRSLIQGRCPPGEEHNLSALSRGVLAAARVPMVQRLLEPRRLRSASKWWMPLGDRVVILGADLAAIELAEFLAARGRKVGVLEDGDTIAPEVGPKRRAEHMLALDRAGIPVNTGIQWESTNPSGVVIRRSGGSVTTVPADHIIIAGGVVADPSLYEALDGRVLERYAVGDCTGFGLIRGAILDGARAACKI